MVGDIPQKISFHLLNRPRNLCLDTWATVSLLKSHLPLSPWTQQPAILNDAHNRLIPIYLELVDSWKESTSCVTPYF
jgi:hypothetical protein